jgi:hypothetical protein
MLDPWVSVWAMCTITIGSGAVALEGLLVLKTCVQIEEYHGIINLYLVDIMSVGMEHFSDALPLL